jgi:hypothetical protein
VWNDTHFVAMVAFAMASGAGIVLMFFMPQVVWQIVWFVGLFGVPTTLSILYSYFIWEDQYQIPH